MIRHGITPKHLQKVKPETKSHAICSYRPVSKQLRCACLDCVRRGFPGRHSVTLNHSMIQQIQFNEVYRLDYISHIGDTFDRVACVE